MGARRFWGNLTSSVMGYAIARSQLDYVLLQTVFCGSTCSAAPVCSRHGQYIPRCGTSNITYENIPVSTSGEVISMKWIHLHWPSNVCSLKRNVENTRSNHTNWHLNETEKPNHSRESYENTLKPLSSLPLSMGECSKVNRWLEGIIHSSHQFKESRTTESTLN